MKQLMPILMTATVDPRGMKSANFLPREREQMYVDTLNYYITDLGKRAGYGFSLVFAENSGWEPGRITGRLQSADNVDIEYIALDLDRFDPQNGKSYNEMLLIDMALDRSEKIGAEGRFFKVTGRFPITNLFLLLREVYRRGGDKMRYYGDCKDHRLFELMRLPYNGHAAECRYWAASVDFYNEYMRGSYAQLNGDNIETYFLKLLRPLRSQPGVSVRFVRQANITGKGGHYLGSGSALFTSTDNDSFALRAKRALRQLTRWVFPFLYI